MVHLARRPYGDSVRLICALPYENFSKTHHFDDDWRMHYSHLKMFSQKVINVTGNQNREMGCYLVRNTYMVDNSSLLICYHTGKSGGTADTVQYAREEKLDIINVVNYLTIPENLSSQYSL